MKKILILLIGIFLLYGAVRAQEKVVISEVFYKKNETIKDFKGANSFIGVTTFESIGGERKYYAYILDASNNTKYKIDSKTGYIFQTIPLEKIQSFLVFERPSEAKILISSYNLINGLENWEQEISGYSFSISGDQKYLLAPKQPEEDNSKFQVVDLESGNTLKLANNFKNYIAEFYDDQRIVFFIQEIERNPEYYTDTPEMITKKYRIDEINKEIKNIGDAKDNKLITKSEYDTKLKELIRESDLLKGTIYKLRSNSGLLPWKLKPLKVIIYNYKNDFIEQEKYIQSNSRNEINLLTSDMGIGVINVNKFGEIFFLCSSNNETKFGKLGSNLELKWLIKYEAGRIIKIINGDELLFAHQKLNDNTLYEINPQSGQLTVNKSLSILKENLQNIGYNINVKNNIILEKGNMLKRIMIGGYDE